MGLKQELKNDIWKIIDGMPTPKIKVNKFRILVLQLLLQSKGFNVGNAFSIADSLEEEYNKIIDDFEVYLEDSNGDLLTVLKNVDKDYNNKIEPLLKRLKNI